MDNEKDIREQDYVEETKVLTIKELLLIIKRNLILIIAVILFATGIGAWYSTTVPERYTAQCDVKLMASFKEGHYSGSSDYTLTQKVAPTLSDFLKTLVLEQKANEFYKADENGYKTTGAIYKSSISMKYTDDSDIAHIYYTDTDATRAAEKLDAVYEALKSMLAEPAEEGSDWVSRYFPYSVGMENLSKREEDSNLLSAYVPSKSSNRMSIIIRAILVGAAAAAVLVFLRYILDDTVRTKDELERITGVKTFAYIEDVAAHANQRKKQEAKVEEAFEDIEIDHSEDSYEKEGK